jgi:hypothetical protein
LARRLTLLLASVLLLIPIAGAQAKPATGAFFGTAVSAGTSLASLDMGNNLTMKNVKVSSVDQITFDTSTISAKGSLYIGSDPTPLPVSVSYTNKEGTGGRRDGTTSGSWSITIAKNSAGPSYAPRSGSGFSVDLNSLSGTLSGSITNGQVSTGSLSASLTVTVRRGTQSYTGTAAVSSTGIQTTFVGDDLTVNGTSLGSLKITASSATSTLSAFVTLGTSNTTINAAITYIDSKNWLVSIAKNGATGAAAASGAPINFNNVSGTISKTNGVLSMALSVAGVTVGSATFDANLTVSAAGFTESATVDNVTLASGYTIKNAAITVSTATNTASISGELVTGDSTVNVSASYSNASNWSISMAANSAGAGHSAPKGTTLDVNDISGTITDTNGNISSALTASGVALGDGTFDMVAAFNADGTFTASAILDNVPLASGYTIKNAAITVSTATNTASILGQLVMGGTTLNVSASYSDASNWSISIAANSAEADGAPGASAASGAPIDFNNVSGTISEKNGVLSTALSVAGVTVGSATFDANLTASPAGFNASATVDNVTLASGYTIKSAAITVSTVTNTASISGELVTSGSTVNVSASYSSASNWSISMAANSASAGHSTPNSTTLDINAISGTINDVNGNISSALTASGVALGDGTFDMVATFNADGTFTASASGKSLTIGGMLLNSAAITVSTATPYAEISADFTTVAGTFSFDIQATGRSGGGYSLYIQGSAADLAVASTSSDFALTSFGFTHTVVVPATGCTSWDTAVNGQLMMRGYTYTLNSAEIAFSCNTLTKFELSITVSHKTSKHASGDVTLTINWFSTYGSYTPTFGTKSSHTSTAPYKGKKVDYYSGFFGTVDFSYNMKWSRDDFNTTVTFGLGFSLAAYQKQVQSKTGSTPSAGAWNVAIGAIGYFDAAERVSGDIKCDLNIKPNNDFVCSGDMRVNPPNAGIWHEDMEKI